MKPIFWAMMCCLFFVGCEPKPEEQYNDLLGQWYMHAAYKVGSDVDLLPMADLVGCSCMKTSVLHVTEGEFVMDSECDWLACSGTYQHNDGVINGCKTDGEQLLFYFKDGVLSTIHTIEVLGDVEMRFQKITIE